MTKISGKGTAQKKLSESNELELDNRMNGPKKLAVLNDMAGYGRCALTAAIPVISALKVQCCPVVTAVLSSHAAYPHCYFDDYTDRMEAYISQWKLLDFHMDGIMTGFLGSPRQAGIAADFIRHFKRDDTMVLVDPTMGDNGRLYSVCDAALVEAMKELIQYADIVTPNITEACFLTDTPHQESGWSREELNRLTCRLQMLGAKAVVLTGITKGNRITNVIHEQGKEPIFLSSHQETGGHHGTGDVFAAVIGASVVRGVSLEQAVRRAATFTRRCVERSNALQIPEKEGLCLEECLPYLMKF